MKKELPKVYANPINKSLNNNRDIYYSRNNEIRGVSNINVNQKINEIFASRNHVYKSKVRITTATDTFETVIVGKTSDYLLTLSGDKVNISNIENIEKI